MSSEKEKDGPIEIEIIRLATMSKQTLKTFFIRYSITQRLELDFSPKIQAHSLEQLSATRDDVEGEIATAMDILFFIMVDKEECQLRRLPPNIHLLGISDANTYADIIELLTTTTTTTTTSFICEINERRWEMVVSSTSPRLPSNVAIAFSSENYRATLNRSCYISMPPLRDGGEDDDDDDDEDDEDDVQAVVSQRGDESGRWRDDDDNATTKYLQCV